MEKIHPFYLHKNEDLETYKRFAEKGMDLMFPVSVKGKTHRSDINIPYHTTLKLFDTSKDKPEQAHEVASKLDLNPPDPKEVQIEPTTLKGRTGYSMHVIKLHGRHAEAMKEQHKKFSHLGYQESYEYSPHITVDEQTWNEIVNSKARTAHEAGIQFMPATLMHEDKAVATYHPKKSQLPGGDAQPEDKLAASELWFDPMVVKETIEMDLGLLAKHSKVFYLGDNQLKNYLQDNPGLKEEVMKKHEERLSFHFKGDKELVKIAWDKGLWEAYEALKNRK